MSMTSLLAQEEGRAFVETAQLHGTYFKCEDKDERDTRVSQLGRDEGLTRSLSVCNLKKEGKKKKTCNESHEETVPLPIQRHEKIEEADLLNTLDWLVAPVNHCLGCYNTKCKIRPWIHCFYNMSKEGEFTAQHKLPPKYKDDNHFKQDWFMGIYMQLVMNIHCPEWVDNKPTCATNFAFMEFPIFARDTEDMEASAVGPDIQLAQSWESPSTINSKATWGLGNDLISTIRCKDARIIR
eukprot:jgi/Psemu1/15073/gm1.15073_g